MKTVIVFDTEDQEGMKNSYKIINMLATEYNIRATPGDVGPAFGKIEFIKMIRACVREAEEAAKQDPLMPGSLSWAKRFTEKVFSAKNAGGRYQG